MLDLRFHENNRKTFLSPQCLRNIRTIQSPKFDHQKAQQDHIKRKIIYEQKLARYDQYNSILSAKANKEIESLKSQLKYQTDPNKNSKKNQPLSNEQKIIKSHEQKSLGVKKSSLVSNVNKASKKKNLEQLRLSNRTLHSRNTELKSYLKELNSGVSQLECILQEVQMTYASLNQANPEFKGLWILNEHEENEEYIKSQKNTKDTVDFEYDKRENMNNIYKNEHSLLKVKNKVDVSTTIVSERIESIDCLQRKFKGILQKIAQRQSLELKVDAQLSELNAIERQLDQLKRSSVRPTLANSKSQKSVQIPVRNSSTLLTKNQTLSKVKSLGRILA